MGSDGGNAEGAGGVTPLGDSADRRNFRLESQGGGTGVVIGVGGPGGGGDVSNEGVHLDAEGYHHEIYRKSPHL